MTRWLSRALLLLPILLCLLAWVLSYQYEFGVGHGGARHWIGGGCVWGQFHLTCFNFRWAEMGWFRRGQPASPWYDQALAAAYPRNYCLGFFHRLNGGAFHLALPLWFPTTLALALFGWLWHATRLRKPGPGFPVELAPKEGKA